jgi:hypothetical protein
MNPEVMRRLPQLTPNAAPSITPLPQPEQPRNQPGPGDNLIGPGNPPIRPLSPSGEILDPGRGDGIYRGGGVTGDGVYHGGGVIDPGRGDGIYRGGGVVADAGDGIYRGGGAVTGDGIYRGGGDDFSSRYTGDGIYRGGGAPDWATTQVGQTGGYPDTFADRYGDMSPTERINQGFQDLSGGGGARDPTYASGATYPVVNQTPQPVDYSIDDTIYGMRNQGDSSSERYLPLNTAPTYNERYTGGGSTLYGNPVNTGAAYTPINVAPTNTFSPLSNAGGFAFQQPGFIPW